MNVLYINIIAHMDIDVRICQDRTGKKKKKLQRNKFFISFENRCIRERNCGTGYQVDPVTQTCIGKIFCFFNKSGWNSILFRY